MLDPETPIPAPFAAGPARKDWEELLALLLRDGILYRTAEQTVVSRDGTPARWMLESWPVSLSAHGGSLAARCLLKLLEGFEGTQLATYGMTGIPLLQSCILASGGKYTGLVLRKERKGHGSRKLIEGRVRPDEPVVLLDDSVSSGKSSWEAWDRLREAGLRLEGGVCLVRFGYQGGFSFMEGRGFHMAAVYDVWDHLMRNMPDERIPVANPSRRPPPGHPSTRRAPEDLHPATLARVVMRHWVETREILKPPRRMKPDLETRGGVWVSLRSQQNLHLRYARDGFWRFPEEPARRSAADDVVFAAASTASRLPAESAWKQLEDSGVAVTGFGPLEACGPGQLDNDRYGIVVRSRERIAQMGGALPRMPGITDRWRQFQHARIKNGKLFPHESFELLRHDVFKAIEPGMQWQPTGTPDDGAPDPAEDASLAGPLATWARSWAAHHLGRAPAPGPLAPVVRGGLEPSLDSVYVTVYRAGRLCGCMGSVVREGRGLDRVVPALVEAALQDPRFAPRDDDGRLAVSVSLLTRPLRLGHFSPDEVMERVRLGQQALMAVQGEKAGLLLPFVAAQHDHSRGAFARDVLRKAGIDGGQVVWHRFDCSTWIDDGTPPARKLLGAFPARRAPVPVPRRRRELTDRLRSLADYLIFHQRGDGDCYLTYRPLTHHLEHKLDLPRLAHGTWVLARAARILDVPVYEEAARARLAFLDQSRYEDEGGRTWLGRGRGASAHDSKTPSGIAELAFTALAHLELDGDACAAEVTPVVDSLWQAIDRHGRFRTHKNVEHDVDAFQDYTPGQALLALGRFLGPPLTDLDEDRALGVVRAWSVARHRSRYHRHFGQVCFWPQAALVWDELVPDDENAASTFALLDWVLGYQADQGRHAGAFYNDHQADTPGFTTALYVEGLAAGSQLAARRGERARAARYREAAAAAVPFLDGLVLTDEEAAVLPNPALARGGVRPSHLGSAVRIDFVAHTLAALLGVQELLAG